MADGRKTAAERLGELATARGEETRRRILEEAVAVATREGLEGLTIGRLAQALSMSKAGLFAHFGSKEELQLATVQAARDSWVEHIVKPAMQLPRGVARLMALYEFNVRYGDARNGGCFFAAASAEFDGRPGPVRDRVAALMREWLDTQINAIRLSVGQGELLPDVDAEQLAFELQSLVLGVNWARELLSDQQAGARSLRAARTRLASCATEQGRRVLEESEHANQSV